MAPKKKPKKKKLSLGPAPLASFDTELESEADQQSASDEGSPSPSSEESKSLTGSIKHEPGILPDDQVEDDGDDTPTPTNQDGEGIMEFPSVKKKDPILMQAESPPEVPKPIQAESPPEVSQLMQAESPPEVSKQGDVGTKPKIPVRTAPKIPPAKSPPEITVEKREPIVYKETIAKNIKLVDRIEKAIPKEIEIERNGTSEISDSSIDDKPKSPLSRMKKKVLWGSSPKFGAIPKISLTKSVKKDDKGESSGKQLQKADDSKKFNKDDKKKEKLEEKQRLEKLKEVKRLEEKRKDELKKEKIKEEKRKKDEKRKAEEKRRDEKRKEDKKLHELKLEQKKKEKKKKEGLKQEDKGKEPEPEFKKVSKESIKRKDLTAQKEERLELEKAQVPFHVENGEEKVEEIRDVDVSAEEEINVTVAVIETETAVTKLKKEVEEKTEEKESESSDEIEMTESEVEVEAVQQDIPKLEDREHAEIADKLISQESVDYDDEQFPMLENIPLSSALTPITTPRKRYDVVTIPLQRPRPNTPIQIASLEDYITIASGMEKSQEGEKIKILLPEEEFIKPAKSPKRTSSKSWFDFCEGGLQSPRILRSPQLNDSSSSSPTVGSPAKLPLSSRIDVNPAKTWVMFQDTKSSSPVQTDGEAKLSDEETDVCIEEGNVSADIESMTEDDSKHEEQVICRIKLKTRHISEDQSSDEETTFKKDEGSSSDSDETLHNSEESLGESDSTLEDGWQAFERTRAVKVGIKKGDHLTSTMLLPRRGRLSSTGVTDGETDLEPVWADSPDFFAHNGEAIISDERLPSPEEPDEGKDEIIQDDFEGIQALALKRQDTKGKILMKQPRAVDIEDSHIIEAVVQESTVELENELIVTDEKVFRGQLMGPNSVDFQDLDVHTTAAEIHSIPKSAKDEINEQLLVIENKNEYPAESPSPSFEFLNVELRIIESSENLVDMNKLEKEEKDNGDLVEDLPTPKTEIPSAASYPQLPIDLVSTENNILSKVYTSIERVNELDSGLYSWTRTTTVSAVEMGSELDLKPDENIRTYSLSELAALTEEIKSGENDVVEEHPEVIDDGDFNPEHSYVSFNVDDHLFQVGKEHPIAHLFDEETDYSYRVDESLALQPAKNSFVKDVDYSQNEYQYQPTEIELTQEYQQDETYSSYQEQEFAQTADQSQPSDWDHVAEHISDSLAKTELATEVSDSAISYYPSSLEENQTLDYISDQKEIYDISQVPEEMESNITPFVFSGTTVYTPESRPPPPDESPPPPPDESPPPSPDEIYLPLPTSVTQAEGKLKPVRRAPPPPPGASRITEIPVVESGYSHSQYEYDMSQYQNDISQYQYDLSQYQHDYAETEQFYAADVYGDAPPPSTTTAKLSEKSSESVSQLILPTGQLTSSFLNLFDPVSSAFDVDKYELSDMQSDTVFIPAAETPDLNGQNPFEEVFLPMKPPITSAVNIEWSQSQKPVSQVPDFFEALQEIQGELPLPPASPAPKAEDWPTGTFTRRDSGIRFPRKQVRTESQADIDDFIGGQSEPASQAKATHDDLLSLDDQREQEISLSKTYEEESPFQEGKPKNVFKALADIKPWKKKKKKFRPKPVNLAKLVGSDHVMISKKKKKGKGFESDDRIYESFSSTPQHDESIDKESEDWLAFQRMTQRVTETVQKSKTNLDKLAISSTVDSRASIKKVVVEEEQIEVKSSKPSWVYFDDDFIPSSGDSSAAPSCIETPTHTPTVHSPKPTHNSLRNSLTDLNQEIVEESFDILGLGEILPQTTTSKSKSILEQDLDFLGLNSVSFSQAKPASTAEVSLMDDPFGLESKDSTNDSKTITHSRDLFDFEESDLGTTGMASQSELFDITSTTSMKTSSDMSSWDIFGSSPAPIKEKHSDALFSDPFSANIPENIAAKSWSMPDNSSFIEETPAYTTSSQPSPQHSLNGSSTSSPSRSGWSTFDDGKMKQKPTPPTSRKASVTFQDTFAFPTSTTTGKQDFFSMASTQSASMPADPFLITDSLTSLSTSTVDQFHSVSQMKDPFSHSEITSTTMKLTEPDPFDTMHILEQHKGSLWMGFESSETSKTITPQVTSDDFFGSVSSLVSSKDHFGTEALQSIPPDFFGTSAPATSTQDLFSSSDTTAHDLFGSASMTTTTKDLFESHITTDSSKEISWDTFGDTSFNNSDKDSLFDTSQVSGAPKTPAWPSFDEGDTMDTTTLIPKSSQKEHEVKSAAKISSDAWPTDSSKVETDSKTAVDPFSSGKDSDPLLSQSDVFSDPFSDGVSDWTKRIDDSSGTLQEEQESIIKTEFLDQSSMFVHSTRTETDSTLDDSFSLQKSVKPSEGFLDFVDTDSANLSEKASHLDGDPFYFSSISTTDSTSQNPFATSMDTAAEPASHNPFLQSNQDFSQLDTSLEDTPVKFAPYFQEDSHSSSLLQASDDFDPFTLKSTSSTPSRIAPLPPPLKLSHPAEPASDFDIFDTQKSGLSFPPRQTAQGIDNETFDPFAASKPAVNTFGFDQFGDDSDGLTSPPSTQTRFNPFDKEVAFTEGIIPELPEASTGTEIPESPCSYKPESPLFDEDDSEPLEDFPPKWEEDGWEMMLRLPSKKKITGSRYWKKVYVRLADSVVQLFNSKDETEPFQELPLQACYSVSHVAAQQYDSYGKIHTIKIQYVFYRERVGIRPGQIPKLTQGHITKLGLPLEHAPQTSQLLKIGSQNYDDLKVFINTLEDALMRLPTHRERSLTYRQEEIQFHVQDEFFCYVLKNGEVQHRNARVRVFCLSFISGMPDCEVGLNDILKRGKEVVSRYDIIPIKTEEWIRIEQPEFHSCVMQEEFDSTRTVKYHPLDACQFEIMRFRIRPPRNRELPLHVKCLMTISGSKIELRSDVMVSGYYSRKSEQPPCEDIQIRFPIPEPWVYLFRVEKRFGYGSVKSAIKKPGKIKGLERLKAAGFTTEPSLIEVSTGSAKYEHAFRAIVWRISRLPERNQGAYSTQLLVCRLELASYDEVPENFQQYADVEFTMPMTTASHSTVRSISVANSTPPEKFVRYIAKYEYKIEIDHTVGSESGMGETSSS